MGVGVEVRGRPETDEHIPYYRQYIDLVPEGEVIAIMERQVAEIAEYFAGFSAADALWRPAPGEWCAIEVAGHLADSERLLMHRGLRIARGDETPWENIEPELFVENGGFCERELEDVVAEVAAVRGATVAFLRGLDTVAWERRLPETFSVRSVRAMTYAVAGHVVHHLNSLKGQRDANGTT